MRQKHGYKEPEQNITDQNLKLLSKYLAKSETKRLEYKDGSLGINQD